MTYLRPSYHPDGVMRGETSLDEGLYTVFITGEAVPPVHYQYPLRVQMINYANIFRAAIGPLIALLLLSLLGYKLMKSEKVNRFGGLPDAHDNVVSRTPELRKSASLLYYTH